MTNIPCVMWAVIVTNTPHSIRHRHTCAFLGDAVSMATRVNCVSVPPSSLDAGGQCPPPSPIHLTSPSIDTPPIVMHAAGLTVHTTCRRTSMYRPCDPQCQRKAAPRIGRQRRSWRHSWLLITVGDGCLGKCSKFSCVRKKWCQESSAKVTRIDLSWRRFFSVNPPIDREFCQGSEIGLNRLQVSGFVRQSMIFFVCCSGKCSWIYERHW